VTVVDWFLSRLSAKLKNKQNMFVMFHSKRKIYHRLGKVQNDRNKAKRVIQVIIKTIRCPVPSVRITCAQNLLLLWDRVVWKGFFIFTICCDWSYICCCLVVCSLVEGRAVNWNTFWITAGLPYQLGVFPFSNPLSKHCCLGAETSGITCRQGTWTDITALSAFSSV
jgi:hypothetical protein